ncbi:MAG TPA: hypothetical protein VGD84_13880 [Pseudonocardiaceae bacterium]
MNDSRSASEERAKVLRDLITRRVPVAEASAALARFGWDSDDELVTLTRADVLRVLRDYAGGRLTAEDIARWAEALEGREDVGREAGFDEPLTEFLFEAATPEVAGPLTPESAQRWAALLGGETAERP